ncbi:MAG: hypothetical protein O2894_12175, partial [Planctomycetota bacterium]|nr:hypothetical protein [Planctomycetota bacterium]
MRSRRAAWAPSAFLGLCCAALAAHAGEEGQSPSAAELALLARARPSVVRVRLRDARFGDVTTQRHAVVVRQDGLLVLAGSPPSPTATLTAVFADGRELRARLVASDPETALTLVRVPTSGLVPIPGG